MMQQDKKLLLKDLCARLPYGVKLSVTDPRYKYNENGHERQLPLIKELEWKDIERIQEFLWMQIKEEESRFITHNFGELVYKCHYKPYLRPLSSMTEKERIELRKLCDEDLSEFSDFIKTGHGLSRDGLYMFDKSRQLDFCLSHHFDYRNLIEKGLAIAVTEENNPYK